MLLTSSQVSIAISSFIIFIFTTALFLSGYILQQQTVRDLRAAIRPQLLPRPKQVPELYLPPQFKDTGEYLKARGVVDVIGIPLDKDDDRGTNEGVESEEFTDESMVGATRSQKKKRKMLEEQARREREQKQKSIIESSERVNSHEEPGNEDLELKEKPISPAERRRRIKEQILAEGEGEGFKGYRRKMY